MKRRPWSNPKAATSIAQAGEQRSGWPAHTWIALAGILGLALLVLSL
ncbi:hypothetical protein [Reyranella sp.]